MSGGQRIKNVLIGILIILGAVILIAFPEEGIIITASILSLSLFVYGIKTLIYYITMTRHMVGGRIMLYLAVVVLDLGMFTMMLTNIPKMYIALYLVVVYAFSGAIDILRALEARKYQAPSWRFSLISGIINVVIAILCIVFIGSTNMIVYLYSAGLIYSAIVRIITAFRKTAIVYIQ
ncbi:DUF308 domain-containing protein [Ruminococcus sp.]|uniref:DUF308 domain-containing protein n=1 Tax=Ruminococcus sp. TaxID=41978 RepID=UPI002E80D714|nr:DUF308 domain-containing protein [Ruminococcus sp.]MEE3491956.1 DUF308 domain-containing protein [Ruminococcus sp.]